MSGRDHDDLEWLYRRRSDAGPADDPDATRAFTEDERADLGARTSDRRPGSDRPSASRPSRPTSPIPPPQPGVRPVPAPPVQRETPSPRTAPRADHARPPRPPRRRRNRVGGFFAVVVLLITAVLAYLIAVPVVAWSRASSVDDQPTGERPADQPGQTYLLVGSDSREGLSEEERRKLGTGDVEGRRTDTMMILYVPPGGRPALISLPRDSYVPIPGNGSNKINAAYAFGGPELLTQTVEQATGLRIDHYVEIGFGGFVGVIDALDGVEMCPTRDIKDANSHLDIKAGCQTMDGVTALSYARMRYADPEGDLGRVKRQREMIAAIGKKAATPMTVINPVRYYGVNAAMAEGVGLGEDTSLIDMPAVLLAMRGLTGPDALTLTVPIKGNATTNAGDSLIWDEAKAEAMFGLIKRGTTAGLEEYKQT